MNARPGLITAPKDSTLDQPTTITVTINATFLPIRVSNTVEFFPHHTPPSATLSTDKITLVLQDLLQNPSPPTLFPNYGTDLHQCIQRLHKHLTPASNTPKPNTNKTTPLPLPTPRMIQQPTTTKGVPTNGSKGGHPTSKPKTPTVCHQLHLFFLLVQSSENGLPTDDYMRVRLFIYLIISNLNSRN